MIAKKLERIRMNDSVRFSAVNGKQNNVSVAFMPDFVKNQRSRDSREFAEVANPSKLDIGQAIF